MKNYDDLIPAAPPEQPAARTGNKYDEIIDAPPVHVMAVSLSALSRNPEQSAKARTLGQRYGLPPSVIERNLPELEKRALQDTNSAVLQRSPKLSRFIGADPDRAAVAVDDLPTFGEIERTLGTPLPRRRPLTGAFKDAAAEARRARDRFERALTGARSAGRAEETPVDYSIADRVRYGYGQARAGLPIVMNELTGLYEGDQFGLALAISDRLREAERANLATPPAAVTEGARRVGEAEGFVESGAAVLGSPAFVLDTVFTSLGQSAPSMLAGVAGAAAGPAGQALGAGTGSLAVEYSASLIESIREAGLTPTNAQEVYRALSDPALMDQARDKALKRGLAIGAFDALTAGLAGNILRNARGASRTAMAAAVAGEAGLQAAGGAGGELVAQLLTESNVRWGEVFLEGIAEIASGVVEVPSNLRAAREAAEARFARNDHNAMLAEYHANQVKQLSELAGASKVLARDPQTLQEFIDNVAREGGRVEDIYVDARQFAQTVGDEKLAELRQASPAVAAQIDEALAIGGDLVIPLGEFATTIGQSDVMPSVLELVRPDAAEMSLAEAKQFAQTRDDQMLAEAERALEEAGEASDFSRSAAAVEQRVTQELQTANRFTEAVNTRYAKLVSAFFTTMAKRTGVLPEQFAARYSLQVRNEAVQGERRMEQGEEVFDWSNPGGKGVGGYHSRDTKVGDTTVSYGVGADGVAEIISVRTPRAKRRAGSARRALEAFLREADARGFTVKLQSSPLDNKTDGRRLFDFYRSLGFEPTGRKINQVGDPEMIRPPRAFNQSAYHGTPHRFERFSLEHIGAGEGVQAFGWGLYFTSERDIAEWYRRKLSEDQAVVNWRIGNRYIVRDEQVQDYSPRPASGDIGQAWSVAVEGLMLAESELRDTLYAGGDVRAKAAEILDEIIEIEKSGDYRQSFVFHLERIRDQARDGMVFDLTQAQGQVYQVNIPDETEMLAWDKPLSEQPEKVREALAAAGFGVDTAAADELNARLRALNSRIDAGGAAADDAMVEKQQVLDALESYDPDMEGQDVYQRLISEYGSDEAASKYLNSIGVRGISYQADGGRTDARNFVVFDDSAIEVLNAFYQRQEALRGQITFGTDITRTPSVISLFEQANLSTFLHESGHFFLEVMADVAARGAQPQVMDDMDALLRWFGVPDLGTWLTMTPDQQRPYHEQFARGFERYLLEGKAPARSLESLFATFRSWLVSVYRSLIGSAGGADAALNVTVSDEVRSVMDRMIASDEEIAEAQDARRYAPLFKSAAEMGATTAEWAAYQREHGDALEAAQAQLGARSLREMRWLSGAKSRELKRLQGEAKAARAAVEEEATAEVRAEPVYAAMRWLKHGEMVNAEGEQIKALSGFKLDAERAREILTAGGLESTALGVGKYGMVAKEGLDPQVVAEMFGFPNGETLIHAIVGATPEADAIEALTDQRMLERYGELVDDRAMGRAADAAVHNEARGRFVAVELRALTRALNKQARTPAGGSVNALARAARELADRIVLRKPIKDIKPARFSTAEVRAAKAAEKALAGNDLTAAVTEKRNQMVNFYAARAAHNALGRFEIGLRKMKRALESEGIDQEYRDQIAAILDRYNLRPMTKKEQQRAKSLVAWVDAQKAAGYEPVIDEDVLNEARRVPVRDLTVEEFDGLVASVENIAHLGRLKKKLLTAKDAREFAARVDEAEAAIRDNATRTIPEQIEKGRLARFRSGVKEFFVMHRKFANTIYEMDGWRDGGALWELFVRPMNEAGDREAVMREQATIRLSELFKAVSKDARRKVFIPEIDTALTAEARIMVALNTGNAGNLQRLMDGDRWSIGQVKAITDTLTKEQWDFVQGVWDLIDEYRPQIAEQQKRITGVEPKWVEPTPVDTPHGVYRGGYFPAKYDTDRSTRSLSDEAAAGVMDQWRATRGAARTRDSFTRERAAKVIMRPLRKDFGVVTQHITEVTHRLAWQEYLIDATRLLNASQIDAAVREHYGPEVLRSMRDTIADVAAGEVGAQNAFEKSVNHLRVGTTIVGLAWNIVTGMLQPIGLTQSIVRIGPKWVAKGAAQWLGDAVRMESSVAAVYEKSEFMRLRGKTMQREISEIRNTVSGTDSRLAASYFYFIQKLQIVADIPTWLGMYTKAIETMNVDEPTAVALADQAVLDAQSGGQVKDLAAIQRGGPMLKLFTNFYSFFNTTFNLTRVAYGRTNFYKPGEAGLFLVDMLLLYTVPAVLGTLLKAALQGDTDDEDELVKKLIADQMNYLLGTMVGLREIGGATAAALGLPSGYSGPAGVRFFSEVQKLAKQVEQGEADAAFFKALNSSAGILFHYPAGQLNRTAEGVNAYLNGETENPAALIVGPPR